MSMGMGMGGKLGRKEKEEGLKKAIKRDTEWRWGESGR